MARITGTGAGCGGVTRRRAIVTGGASLALWGLLPRVASAQGRDARLLVVVLRGGLDGLALAGPVGDPEYARLRGAMALQASGASAGLPLDGSFLLNPNMPFLHALYGRREATILHAIATPYRGRSHFDGQDVLESGLGGVGRSDSGWLNRALTGLVPAGAAAPRKGLAMGAVVPLVMRGPVPVLSWIPKTYNLPLSGSTIARLADLYSMTDPGLAKAFAEGIEIDRIGAGDVVVAGGGAAQQAPRGGQPQASQAAQPRQFREFLDTAEAAARFLASPDGPRIGALSYNGWDTHANEGAVQGQLANRLAGLDAAIKALHDGLGPTWKETVVAIVTEFGRTARANGTDGTDHGTGMAALLVGGAVKGGRVVTDWPGLGEHALYEGRDLKPTMDLRGMLKGVLRDLYGLPERQLSDAVFPDSGTVQAIDGLVA